jgi:hypothetical protein
MYHTFLDAFCPDLNRKAGRVTRAPAFSDGFNGQKAIRPVLKTGLSSKQ